MGLAAAVGEFSAIHFTAAKQIIRRSIQISAACTLFGGLTLCGNINFQFAQLFFDISSGIITGAFFQFCIARLILPFIMGNGFCSRACWDGAVFETIDTRGYRVEKPAKRNELVAFAYLCFLVSIPVALFCILGPGVGDRYGRFWSIGENIIILSFGILGSRILGSRIYCRTLCPFLTVSGMISRYSVFKITPQASNPCSGCGECNRNCPMLIDVRSFALSGTRINDRSCILCERCADGCRKKSLRLAPDFPWK